MFIDRPRTKLNSLAIEENNYLIRNNHYISNRLYCCFSFITAMVQRIPQILVAEYEGKPSMHFRRANTELSMDFRKANTEPFMYFRRANTETY